MEDADPAAMSDEQRTRLRQGIENMHRNLALVTLVSDLRRRASIEIPKESDTP